MNDWQAQARRFFLRGGNPLTLAIIAVTVVTWFINLSVPAGLAPAHFLAFSSATWPLPFVWTPITWPLAAVGSPINVLFGALWFFTFAGSLERSWGTRTFGLFFAAVSIVSALTYGLGGLLLHSAVTLTGLWVAVAAPTVAWCVINRRESINIWGVLPVPAPLIAVLAVVLVWYQAGAAFGAPLLGLFALSGCGAAYWYANGGRSLVDSYRPNRPTVAPNPRFRDIGRDSPSRRGAEMPWSAWLRKRREAEQIKKLDDLWRRSGFEGDDDKKKR